MGFLGQRIILITTIIISLLASFIIEGCSTNIKPGYIEEDKR